MTLSVPEAAYWKSTPEIDALDGCKSVELPPHQSAHESMAVYAC